MAALSNNINIAELGIASGKAWQEKYPNYKTDFITAEEYYNKHLVFRNNIIQQQQNEGERRGVTLQLKNANKTIDKAIPNLKNYLVEMYGKDSASSYFSTYGIIQTSRGLQFPTDNDARSNAIHLVIFAMSKENNPFKDRKYGLTFWESIHQEHRTAWEESKRIDGNRSILSNKLKIEKEEALKLQSRLRTQLKVSFPENYKSMWRDFGFQEEKYS
mgnify:FL=1